MPRQARLDAPGALHHVMGRRIEGVSIFRSDEEREDFLTRSGALCERETLSVHAWARGQVICIYPYVPLRVPSTFHLPPRPGRKGDR